MKLYSKKSISILLVLLTIILLIISIHLAYQKYINYQNIEKKFKETKHFDNANEFLQSLEKERLKSILYLLKPTQSTLDKLNKQRKKVNVQIKNNNYFQVNEKILIHTRRNIDNSSLNYRLLIFEKFHSTIIEPVITQMEELNLLPYTSKKLQLIKLRENINMENSFLAFILDMPKSMKNEDLLFWEKILNDRKLPVFNDIPNQALLSSIQEKYNIEEFSKQTRKERVKVFISASKAKYPINFKEWFHKSSVQKKKISSIEKILINEDMGYLKSQLLTHQKEMYKYIIISLLMLILFGLLLAILHILNKINEDQVILKNTVKEIEVDLDENKKQEIKEILTHNSSSEIYEFLANEIKEPSRAKDLFLANMSHEIRTPLNGIIGFTRELHETEISEEQKEIIEIIEESSDNLMHIVNDILDFSKIKAGKIELENVLFDPIQKFEASIDTYVAKAREKEIEFKVCIDPEIPTKVFGDPTKITQILTNLISNAVKFTPEKGIIEIDIKAKKLQKETNQQDIELLFYVKDSGIGVSEEEKKKIFDAFSQADASTNRKYGGTGLGLSIASEFIKHMGGKLNLDSKVGEGSKFFFSIALKKPKNLNKRSKKDLSAYTVGYIPPRDNRSIDKNLKTYIEYQGAKFSTYTQRTLLNSMESQLPNLLFIDYKCFDKEGELEYFLDLPLKIVLIVADNREKELINFKEKIDKILHKPVNFSRTLKSLEILTQEKYSTIDAKEVERKFNDINVLVAEDNFINQKLMQSVLSRLGMKVTVVSNGAEALTTLENNSYDIIFMDIQMPIMGGIEATKNILSFEKVSNKKHIPIVALTANALQGDKEKYLAIGMDAYLPKPMNLKQLDKVLTTFIK